MRDVMHRKIISCPVDTPLKELARRLDSEGINALVVVTKAVTYAASYLKPIWSRPVKRTGETWWPKT